MEGTEAPADARHQPRQIALLVPEASIDPLTRIQYPINKTTVIQVCYKFVLVKQEKGNVQCARFFYFISAKENGNPCQIAHKLNMYLSYLIINIPDELTSFTTYYLKYTYNFR